MICFPNAKINLGLNIISRRTDGYHNLETIFYPIPLYDVLEIVPAQTQKTTFHPTGIHIPDEPENNLILKAYHLFCQYQAPANPPQIDIYLHKNIPFGAGIGGGSADAAFMLKLLNDYTQSNIDPSQLQSLAAQLGADCPFFIHNTPVYAEGTGNLFSPIQLSLKGYHLVLVKPDIHVATREAFALVQPKQPETSIREIIKQPISNWKGLLHNDFEGSVFPQHPEIARIKDELYRQGALYAAMTGSGSSLFGIFNHPLPGTPFPGSRVYQMKLS